MRVNPQRHDKEAVLCAQLSLSSARIPSAFSPKSKHNANIIDVTQTVMQDLFAMIMLAETDQMSSDFTAFSQEMKALGEGEGLSIHVMHEDIFNSIHKI